MRTRHARRPGGLHDGALLVMAMFIGCGPLSTATGEVRVSASGEEAAIVGFPTSGPDPITFADGWSVTFDDVLVSIQGIDVSDGAMSLALEDEPAIIDLHDGDARVWTFPGVPARRWSDVEYVVSPPVGGERAIGSVDATDAAAMRARTLSVLLRGTARHPTLGDVDIEIAIPGSIHAGHCENAEDMTLGFVVPPSGTAEVSMVFHLDHLFFDSFVAAEPSLRFEAWAAAAGPDGVVTLDDLRGQDLRDLVGVDGMPLDDEGGALVAYDPPSSGLPAANLREFVLAQAGTLPHWNGEGHCDERYRPPGD